MGFYGLDRGIVSQFWVPLAATEEIMPDLVTPGGIRNERDNSWVMLNARLTPGVSRTQAAMLVNLVKKRLDDTYRKDEKVHEKVTVQTAGGLIAGSATPAFTLMAVLMVVVGLVLLVACANAANLLLACAAAGFALAAADAHAISTFKLPLPIPVVFDSNVDVHVAMFTLGLAVITALLFGLVPAMRSSRPDLVEAIKDGSLLCGRVSRSRLRNTLVV